MSTDDLQPLFAAPTRGGLYQPADVHRLDLAGRLTAAGWTVRLVGDFDERNGFYRQVADQLGFPDYSGHNLDALWDSLRDVPGRMALIIDWRPFMITEPDYADRVREVLAERAAVEPPFAVILDTGPADGTT